MANSQNNQGGNSSNRGFASMDDDKQRDIASQGGKAAHASGNAHEFSSAEAAEAGRKGGQNSHGGGNKAQASNSGNNSGNNAGNSSGNNAGNSGGGTRGGSSEQHAEAGRQSHKNDK
jgi:general stress protein YciG